MLPPLTLSRCCRVAGGAACGLLLSSAARRADMAADGGAGVGPFAMMTGADAAGVMVMLTWMCTALWSVTTAQQTGGIDSSNCVTVWHAGADAAVRTTDPHTCLQVKQAAKGLHGCPHHGRPDLSRDVAHLRPDDAVGVLQQREHVRSAVGGGSKRHQQRSGQWNTQHTRLHCNAVHAVCGLATTEPTQDWQDERK